MTDLVTVVIPTYNRAPYLRDAVDSVLAQTIRNFEIIVVDDGSTDHTRELVLSYKDKVKYLYQDHEERAAARNRGIKYAKGKYIAFLDSDDIWLPNHLEECLRALRGNLDAGLCYSGSYMVDQNGEIISKMACRFLNGNVLTRIVRCFSASGCNASSCLVKKDVFDQVGYFNEEQALSGSEDWEMWVRIASFTKFVSTHAYTVKVRFHNERSSGKVERMARSMILALDTIYSNAGIAPRIPGLKREAYSSMHVIIAINYYASGDMLTARRLLRKALAYYPASLLTNRYLVYTFLRSLLGSNLSYYFRGLKWRLARSLSVLLGNGRP